MICFGLDRSGVMIESSEGLISTMNRIDISSASKRICFGFKDGSSTLKAKSIVSFTFCQLCCNRSFSFSKDLG